MGNPTSRQLQTLQPLSTFEFCPCGTDHDESVNDHALLTPLTLQIIMAIMVTHGAVYSTCVQCPPVPVTGPQPPNIDILQPRAPHPAQHREAVTRVVSINTSKLDLRSIRSSPRTGISSLIKFDLGQD